MAGETNQWPVLQRLLREFWAGQMPSNPDHFNACVQLSRKLPENIRAVIEQASDMLSNKPPANLLQTIQRDTVVRALVVQLVGPVDDQMNSIPARPLPQARLNMQPIAHITRVVQTPAAMVPESADLAIWLRSLGTGEYEAIVISKPADSPVDIFPSSVPPRITLNLIALQALSIDDEAYAHTLGENFFADPGLRRAVSDARQRAIGAGHSLRLRLQFDIADPIAHSIRWELLPDPETGQSLAAHANTLFARFLSSSTISSWAPRRAWPPSALFAIAAPVDTAAYNLPFIDRQQELHRGRLALEGYDVQESPSTTLPGLAEHLHSNPDVLYLLCHGAIPDNEPVLFLEGDAGETVPTLGRSFVTVIQNMAQPPALIVLSVCTSGGVSHQGHKARVALGPELARAGVGAIVAMQDNIAIETNAAAIAVLFREIARHGRIDLAVAKMRSVLQAREDKWWQPVLFLRLRDGLLFER